MKRVYHIRDTQRFLFLALLFPLMPLLLEVVHPGRVWMLLLLEVLFVLFTFWMLFRKHELEIASQWIRIGQGRWAQEVSHEAIHEIFLEPNGRVHLRINGHSRYFRVLAKDSAAVTLALEAFARRNAIPLTDRRPRRERQRERGVGV